MESELLAIVGSNDKGSINEPVIIDSAEKLKNFMGDFSKPYSEPEAKKTKTQKIMDFFTPPIEPEELITHNVIPQQWVHMTDNGSNYYVPVF